MAKKSKLTDAPDWVVRAAKTGAAIVRPGAAFTAAAATFAGVALEGVSNALGTRRLHGESTITNPREDVAPRTVQPLKLRRKTASVKKRSASRKVAASSNKLAPRKQGTPKKTARKQVAKKKANTRGAG